MQKWALGTMFFLGFSSLCFGASSHELAPPPPNKGATLVPVGEPPATQGKEGAIVPQKTWILGQTGVEGLALTAKVAVGTSLNTEWGVDAYYGVIP